MKIPAWVYDHTRSEAIAAHAEMVKAGTAAPSAQLDRLIAQRLTLTHADRAAIHFRLAVRHLGTCSALLWQSLQTLPNRVGHRKWSLRKERCASEPPVNGGSTVGGARNRVTTHLALTVVSASAAMALGGLIGCTIQGSWICAALDLAYLIFATFVILDHIERGS